MIDFDNNITIQKKIFDYIKSDNWDELIELINNTNNDFNYNIVDETNTSLLEHIIINKKINILKIILTKNISLDIVDENNRSILYNIIKYSNIDMLNTILNFDGQKIGRPILEIRDNDGLTPLFYAIKFNLVEIANIILLKTSNFLISDNNGNNALLFSCIQLNKNLFTIIYKYITDINHINKFNENILHLAIKSSIKNNNFDFLSFIISDIINPNIKSFNINKYESKYEFIFLHWCFISWNDTLFNLILSFISKHHSIINFNHQDKKGNLFLHYLANTLVKLTSINPDIYSKFFINFSDFNINFNIFNTDGNTILHIFLSNYKPDFDNIISFLLKKTNVNIPNNLNDTCLLLIFKNNIWHKFSSILSTLKLNIFILDKNNNSCFDYISSSDYDKFISLITNSYIHFLKNSNDTLFLDYFDNKCKSDVLLNNLNDFELNLIKNFNINPDNYKNNKSNFNICIDIVKNKLLSLIDKFKNNKLANLKSYPITKKYPTLIPKYTDVITSTFTGSTFDVLCGLIHLKKKFSNLTTTLNFIDSNIISCSSCNFTGFEILWKNSQIIINNSSNFFNYIQSNIKFPKFNFMVIPIGIELLVNNNIYAHSNYLLIDFFNKTIERFEPHGAFHPYGLDYNDTLFDNSIISKFNSNNINLKYFKPSDYLPKVSFQIKEINELEIDYVGDPNGFCSLWCVWWIDMRLSYPNIPKNKLVYLLFDEFTKNNLSYKKLIRNYGLIITDIRDNFLKIINSNFNEWNNDKIPKSDLSILNSNIFNFIKSIL